LALYLVFLRRTLFPSNSTGACFHAPYIRVLPNHFTTPAFWSLPSFELLKPSPSVYDASVNALKNLGRSYLHVTSLPGCQDVGLGEWRWALAVVSTRQNLLRAGGNEAQGDAGVLALVPGWDMCNHAPGPLSSFFIPSTSPSSAESDQSLQIPDGDQAGCLVAQTLSEIPEGSEVCIGYGPRTLADLLVWNGFVPARKSDEEDGTKIRIGVPAAKREEAAALGIPAYVSSPFSWFFFFFSRQGV
jgi:hypothetical protein